MFNVNHSQKKSNIMKNSLKVVLAASVLFFTSCSDSDDPAPVNEQEVINRVVVSLTETSTSTKVDYEWVEGKTPATIKMKAGKQYKATVAFYNTTVTPVENITEEVIEEADEHFIAYKSTITTAMSLTRSSDDTQRTDGTKIGINTDWTGISTGTGNFGVQLIHAPATVSTSNGYGTYTGGETDVDVIFPIVVE